MIYSLSLVFLSFAGLARAASHGNQGNQGDEGNHLALGQVKQAFKDASIPSALSINFNPKALLEVTFSQPSTGQPFTLEPGIHLPLSDFPSDVCPGPGPSFSTVGHIGTGPFVLVVVDPDVPVGDLPQARHFVGSDFFPESHTIGPAKASALVNTTAAISEWLNPAPPPGDPPHRYTFLLFNQPVGFNNQTLVIPDTLVIPHTCNNIVQNRLNFDLSMFAAETGLGDPIAGTFMLVGPDT